MAAGPVTIIPRTVQTSADVGVHYDELDRAYREIWCEHVHHGYWASGRETVAEATDALVDLVADRLGLAPGMAVADIGCGYGASAARIAARHAAAVTGFTISAAQAQVARARPGIIVHHRDWLANGMADAAFDRAYAIESSEHFADKPAFFAEAWRTLRPGGRLVVCAWLARAHPRRWEVDHLLEPICREGRLPGMGSAEDYAAITEAAGFAAVSFEDISRNVRRTWTICARRFAGKLVTDPYYRALLRNPAVRNRDFALSLPRLIIALRTGAMRYGVFVWRKPDA